MDASRRVERGRSAHGKQRGIPPEPPVYRAIVRGVKGGLIATAVMTLYRWPMFRALPPTAEFWARYLGEGEAEQYPLHGLVLHLLYGASAGGIFGPIFGILDRRTGLRRARLGLVSGLAYGLVLSLVGYRIVFRRVLEKDLASDERLIFHVGHVIYGLTLGTWFGSRERFGEVYD